MQIGLFDHVEHGDRPLTQLFDERLHFAEAADAAGIYCLHVAEHHATPLNMVPAPGVYLGAVARTVKRMRLGPLVYLLPLYSPLRLIEEICMLDHLSHGRLDVGVGRGVSPYELKYHKVEHDRSRDIFIDAFKCIRAGLMTNSLNYASEHFAQGLPIVYVLTVVSKNPAGQLAIRGLYIGDDAECFEMAAALSLQVNFMMMDREIQKAVVFLDPHEFKSTWLGNKSVYRTRMALADNAELIVLAPGVHEFGEDPTIDKLIRKYGYCGTPATLEAVKNDPALAGNLSAAAHLIHGSSEGRFRIRYCPGHLTREEIEGAHYEYGDLAEYSRKYDPAKLKDGWNVVDGEEIFYVSNPGLGLWAYEGRFEDSESRRAEEGERFTGAEFV